MANVKLEKELKNVTSSFKNFLTNQGSNTLEFKLHNILKKQHIKYIDFLIGYFRITGFNKIATFLNDIEEARILVGINIDRATFEANTQTQNIELLAKEQISCFNNEIDSQKYQSIQLLVELLSQKDKLQIRVAPNNDIHAKLYILRDTKNPYEDSDGSVIIGSSNLTHNGLEGNFEINTQLNHSTQIDEATQIFNILWEHSVELTLSDVEKKLIPKFHNYPLKDTDEITPYNLYIKLLIEHFGNRVDFLDNKGIYVPKEYKKLSYQVEAVNDGIMKLTQHNGFFLSDVVGLGKTVVVAMLIKKLEATFSKKVLVVIPPAVKIQWEDTFQEFGITCYDIISLAKLDSVDNAKYELIVVDESHKFKNSESKRYKELYSISLNKKVILLSATPQNNTPSDLYNQIALFQNVKNSTLPQCRNLQTFFTKKEQEYKEIINAENIDEVSLKILSEEIRDKVLRTVMIRRTRYDVEHHDMYRADLDKQGISMPTVKTPKEHKYTLQGKLGKTFDDTAIKITQELNYSRFNLLYYMTDEARIKYYPKESENIFKRNPLSGLMKILLVKRFESSFSAFKISIDRHMRRYAIFIDNFEKDIIYLGKKATDVLDYDEDTDGDYDEFVQKLIENGQVKQLKRSDFAPELKELLNSDYEIFKQLVKTWSSINDDPKLEKFKEVLKKDKNEKIVIFTESVDTLNYLQDNLTQNKKILFITSQNRDEKKEIIKENFDANHKNQKDDYTIIITTDTLAEGINLHRSSIIYNYDIPWNATKLIQRIGRVNRIGTKAEFIHIHNFKPASHIDNLIKLSQKAFVKLQSSHTMMGEDNQIYSDQETVGSENLFEAYKKEVNEKDEELDFLEELRDFRHANPNEFKRISKLPPELSVNRKSNKEGSYVALDINNAKNYVYVHTAVEPITFIEMATALSATPQEKPINAKDTNMQDKATSDAIAYFEKKFRRDEQDRAEGRIDDNLSQKALLYIEEWIDELDISVVNEIEDLMHSGASILLPQQIINLKKSENKEKDLKNIIKNITLNKSETHNDTTLEIRNILSETFIKAIS